MYSLSHTTMGAPASSLDAPDDVVYDDLNRDYDEICAVFEWGAEGKPRYLLNKVHDYLYPASADVRTAGNGGCLLRMLLRNGATTTSSAAASTNATSPGRLMAKIARVFQVRFVCFSPVVWGRLIRAKWLVALPFEVVVAKKTGKMKGLHHFIS